MSIPPPLPAPRPPEPTPEAPAFVPQAPIVLEPPVPSPPAFVPAPPVEPSPPSVPPLSRTVPPVGRFASPGWQRVALFLRGVYELVRHLARRGREVWRSERVDDVRARVRGRPVPYMIGGAAAFTLLVMIASAASSGPELEAQAALGDVSRDAAGVAKLNAAIAALPRCK